MAGIPAGMAAAAGAPYAGSYSGSSTAYNGATVELTVDANGNLTSFDSESYVYLSLIHI